MLLQLVKLLPGKERVIAACDIATAAIIEKKNISNKKRKTRGDKTKKNDCSYVMKRVIQQS